MAWNLQQINNANGNGPTVPGEYVATNGPTAFTSAFVSVFVSAYNNQQHFAYIDHNNGNIQDAWWDGNSNGWNLQQINAGVGPSIAGEYVATNGPAIAGPPSATLSPGYTSPLFVSVYKNQQHFAYLDGNGNLQDAWWDGDRNQWNLQQINNANENGPTIVGEFVATNGPGAAFSNFFVSVYNNQQHFVYIDANNNMQDAWWAGDRNQWNLQQINNANGSGPTMAGEYVAANGPALGSGNIFVSVYNNQQHFVYIDVNSNIQDAWYDGDSNQWNLQQINYGNGPAIAGEYVATKGPSVQLGGPLFVSVYNDQQHFVYIDQNNNIQDAWWDGNSNQWNLQQINTGNGPTIAGEYIATSGPAAVFNGQNFISGSLFVSVYNNQQHFTYFDQNLNIQDAWYDGDSNQWSVQQINNAYGRGPTIPNEYVATNGPVADFGPFVSVYNN